MANSRLQRVLGIGVSWAMLWLAFWAVIVAITGIVDPDSIDPGEGSGLMLVVLGPMGFLSGLAFGSIISTGGRDRTIVDLSLRRAGVSGILGCAIVQLAYLRHGDQGLAANIKVALLFSAIGGLITIVWLVTARRWLRRKTVGTALRPS